MISTRRHDLLHTIQPLHGPLTRPPQDGRTPLSYGVMAGSKECVSALVAAGAEVDKADKVRARAGALSLGGGISPPDCWPLLLRLLLAWSASGF